jgi:amidophosphoribosyltransferase
VYVTGDIQPEDIRAINEARVGQEEPFGGEEHSRLALPNPQDA